MNRSLLAALCFFTSLLFIENFVSAESQLPDPGSTITLDHRNTDVIFRNNKDIGSLLNSGSLTLLFLGDVMGHDSQIRSALQSDGVTYDYTSCFDYMRDYISAADLAIANLEVTLAGPPYKGYPRFSSPDALAAACKDAGIDVLVTANNHCVDRGKPGLERTIKTLDNLKIPHTGTFLSYSDKKNNTPLVIEKNKFKIALINYTAETNEIPVPEPSFVNIVKVNKIKADIAKAKMIKPDVIILFLHWGIEKQNEPDAEQSALADICFKAGADIIIGSHPHVVQKSIMGSQSGRKKFVAYSLGNFIANQKAPQTDGGQMIQLTLIKKDGITTLSKANYMLTWIYGPVVDMKKKFYVLPCKDFENQPEFFAVPEYYNRMKTFIDASRKLLNDRNENVEEIK